MSRELAVTIEVVQGLAAGTTFELRGLTLSIGRQPQNDLVLEEAHVSSVHCRIGREEDRVVLVDNRSTNGTTLVRGDKRIRLGDDTLASDLETGDRIELGTGDAVTTLLVTQLDEGDDRQVLSMTHLDALPHVRARETDPNVLNKLYAAQKRIGAASGLENVLIEVADTALELVPAATHLTLVLRDDDLGRGDTTAFVPVLTRVRSPGGGPAHPVGSVPVARSVYRKVVKERVAVLAADAPSEAFASESMMGASIRSTIGVPLWRGDEVVGVLQADNRSAPGMLSNNDVELLLLLASNASLAVSSARLIKRLESVEEQLKKENSFLKGREEKRRGGTGRDVNIIGTSDAMMSLHRQLEKVVDTRVTVLVEGETGTGKELIAAAVHYRSRRRDKLFVAQNCAAIAENLLESELFGHKKGAFTGAVDDKKGLFEIADGGTLFLDEVNSTSLSLQTKLLRALQEGEIRPVGATASKHVDVRIVAATNRNLEDLVAKGLFREDLYYRLKVFPLHLPPLRERRDDIPLLATHFLARYSQEIGKPAAGFSQQTLELLTSYEWPGNVRELQNEVQRLVIQLDEGGFVTPDLLSPQIKKALGVVAKASVAKGTLREMMDSVEKYLLLENLREHGQNKTAAAKSLGITREGLHKKLRQHGM